MLRRFLILFTLLGPFAAAAGEHADRIAAVLDRHILPGFTRFAAEAEVLKDAAEADCAPRSPALRAAYHAAFDAWLGVSHLRFGPTEAEDRAFALAFWPDTKGFTPKSLGSLIAAEDPVVNDPAGFDHVSIAARGFFALEFMLYDPGFADQGRPAYRCALIRAIARDIDANADAILDDWQTRYADLLRNPGKGESPYRSEEEAVQELFKALLAGLQFTSDTRLGRPLGTFDRPRPNRAEAHRSGRPLRDVAMSLEALDALAGLLAQGHPATTAALRAAFDEARSLAAGLDDPTFAGVANPQGRLRVEILQQSIDRIRALSGAELGPFLGVAAGFNALDGD
ncbi:MAG: imelysin family protein [Paracoccaceae bacterium]